MQVMRWVGVVLLAALCSCGGSGGESRLDCFELGAPDPTKFHAARVVLEVRFLSATNDFVQSLGVDFDTVLAPEDDPFPSFGGQFMSGDNVGVGGSAVGGEAGSTQVVPSGHHNGSFLPQFTPDSDPGGAGAFVFVQAPGEDRQCLTVHPSVAHVVTGTTSSIAARPFTPFGGLPAGQGFGSTVLDDIQLELILRAVEADGRADVISAPRITLFNGQRAIAVADQARLSRGDLQPFVDAAISAFQSEVGPVSTGVTLDVKPVVSADGRSVFLEIRPSSGGAVLDYNPPIAVGGVPGRIRIPIIETSASRTGVLVPDGATLFLGGIKNVSSDGMPGVPLLTNLPYVNGLFRISPSLPPSQELLILVTARILPG